MWIFLLVVVVIMAAIKSAKASAGGSTPKTATAIQDAIIERATFYGVSAALCLAVARQESNFNQAAISPRGAIGVFQLMPLTARDLGVNPRILAENIDGGIRYLRTLLARYSMDVRKALAAYNWGMGNLDRAIAAVGDDWLTKAPAETRHYVTKISSQFA